MKNVLDDLNVHDVDPEETSEWLESLDSVINRHGMDRAHFLMVKLLRHAHIEGVRLPALVQTPYRNTIHHSDQPEYPGDPELELRIRQYIRWNAVAMVLRANQRFPGVGGHLSTYASAATLYEVGFHHFFKGPELDGGDQVFIQGHASPGIYARAFLEGRLTEDHLDHFRREVVPGQGLSSYPHPWLMPEMWQFPTVSMGLSPIAAIYQARFNRYLHNRGFKDTSKQRVWAFLGDGECDEPESLGALHLAARERLDNLTFVVNCNLQRLDGPVRGNSKIIQELEAVFHGAGWRVIKVVWASEWDDLLDKDQQGILLRALGEYVDGAYQRLSVLSGDKVRETFFGQDPRLLEMVKHLPDEQVRRLRRGGHDFRKVYSAYERASAGGDQPTVILAKTVKGWALGGGAEGRNIAHNTKKLGTKALQTFRKRLNLDIPDDALEFPPYVQLDPKSDEAQYLHERRQSLGGYVPQRTFVEVPLQVPERSSLERFYQSSGKSEVSTTGAFARLLGTLLEDKEIGKRIVPIIPDEARTFGLNALFNRYGIYSSVGQLYEPVDSETLLMYRESTDGQVLEEGICEAGSMASFIAAATSYATHNVPLIPFYIFYSMFGFQRTADQIWALGDMRGRGFLIGATAGRTTLSGEGLQHEDGHSLLYASTVPNCRAYDASFAYEIALIVQDGLKRMFTDNEDIFYYLTVENEPYVMPEMPEGIEEGVLAGLYLYEKSAKKKPTAHVQLFGSGAILNEVLRARDILESNYGVAADVWSATSYVELRREALSIERWNRLHPGETPRVPYVTEVMKGAKGPIIASSDYMKAVPEMIARWVDDFTPLGTDGYGRSDTRAALRRHFEVDAEHVAATALWRLSLLGEIDTSVAVSAIEELGIDPEAIEAVLL
ncbi:MAG: pyruvate dehydrogenase (acetyl-transferring), homodimeric type [Myxococcota bacterium]